MACDMSEPCKFPSLVNCQKRFLWTHREVDLAPHSVAGLALEVGDTETFPQALGSEGLEPFSQSQQAGSMSHSHNVRSVKVLRRPRVWDVFISHSETVSLAPSVTESSSKENDSRKKKMAVERSGVSRLRVLKRCLSLKYRRHANS